MFQKHPEETLKSGDDIWLCAISMLFKLTQNPELHRKRYCRRYLVVTTVSLTREILKFKRFNDVVIAIEKHNSHVKFRAVKRIISEVFWDKRTEIDLCRNGADIARNALRTMVDDSNLSRANGIGFTHERCQICHRSVIQSSQKAMNQQASNFKFDINLESMLVFDCKNRSDHNHVFHIRCLKKVIKDEISKDKKASTEDADVMKQLRCIICYQRSQEISGTNVQRFTRSVTRRGANGNLSARGHRRQESTQETASS